MCLRGRVDDLIDGLHCKIECHEFALRNGHHRSTPLIRERYGQGQRTTGCRPASAAPTVSPQKPDSVMGLSMTLFAPNRSSSPFVTLYLRCCFISIRKQFQHSCNRPSCLAGRVERLKQPTLVATQSHDHDALTLHYTERLPPPKRRPCRLIPTPLPMPRSMRPEQQPP